MHAQQILAHAQAQDSHAQKGLLDFTCCTEELMEAKGCNLTRGAHKHHMMLVGNKGVEEIRHPCRLNVGNKYI